MSEVFENKIKELEEKIEKAKQPVWSKLTIGTLITIILLLVTTGVSWGVLRSDVQRLKDDLGNVETIQKSQQKEINETKLKAVRDSSDITNIKEDVREIKDDMKSVNGKLDKLLGD